MKILLTADWHIKLGQKNVPKDWARDRYELFFEKLRVLEDDVDIHIISGDIFDRLPTLEELAIYHSFICDCSVPTLINTGNHESETKKKSFLNHLSYSSRRMNNNVFVCSEISPLSDYINTEEEAYIVPYENIKNEKTWKGLPAVPIFTHVRGEIPPHVKPEIPLEWLKKFPVIFAGDLHSHKNTQGNIVYPGSPMTTSFHRDETKGSNGYIIIDSSDWSWEWYDFELPQLIRKTVSRKEDMVKTDFHHTIYEFEGTLDTIAGEKLDSELLDKKVIKRNSEATLLLTDKMTLEDELVEYLTYIIGVKNVEEIMTVYHEYSKD